jgi:hypothetical protein
MDKYFLTIANLCCFSRKVTPKKKALARLAVRLNTPIDNQGGEGFILPFIPIAIYPNQIEYLPHTIKEINAMASLNTYKPLPGNAS